MVKTVKEKFAARRTNDATLASAMDILACGIHSDDGVVNAAIAEAAQRLRELKSQRDTLWSLVNEAKSSVLFTQITSGEIPKQEVWKQKWHKTFESVSQDIVGE